VAGAEAAQGHPVPQTSAEQSTRGHPTTHHEKTYLQAAIDVQVDLKKQLKEDALVDQLKLIVGASDVETSTKAEMNGVVQKAATPHLGTAVKALAAKLDLEDAKEDNDQALPHVLKALDALLDYAVEVDQDLERKLLESNAAKAEIEAEQATAKAAVSAAEALLAKATADVAAAEKGLAEAKDALSKSETEETKSALAKANATHEAAVETRNQKTSELDALKVPLAEVQAKLAAAMKLSEQAEAIRKKIAGVSLKIHERAVTRLKTAASTYQVALDVVTSSALD